MCGLFAGIGKLSSGRMIALGSMNEERGTDSVGIAYIDRNNVLQVAKVAERPCVALNVTLRKQVTEAAVSGLFIGHTRQATQGAVTSKNAHPFLVDGIAFAHNGVIINDSDFGKFEVDSESLIFGIREKDFSKYEGAIALVWIQDNKLKAYRCGNPLYRGRLNGTLYLASDDDYLRAAGCTGVKELSEGLIYTFHDAMRITTERVSKNKSFTYASKYSSKDYHHMGGYTGYGLEDQYNSKEEKSLIIPNSCDYQKSWWQREKEKEAQELAIEEAIEEAREIREKELKEDFRTDEDIRRSRVKGFQDCCDCCGDYTELNNGYCLACLQYLRDNGMDDKDIPPMMRIIR